MGKKSKKQGGGSEAKSTAAGRTTAHQDAVAAAVGDYGGGIRTSSGGSKKLKCVRCFCNLKDLAKAHQCPGCSNLFCWRCEKKYFEECPCGPDCINPNRRCGFCTGGSTMQVALGKCGSTVDDGTEKVFLSNNDFAKFHDCIREDDHLSMLAIPFAFCTGAGCEIGACADCFMDPKVNRVLRCDSCEKCRCCFCQKGALINFKSKNQTILLDTYERALLEGKDSLDDDDIKRICVGLRELRIGGEADLLSRCGDCNQYQCYACFDDRTIESFARSLLDAMMEGEASAVGRFKCSKCYWASKPCTNPTCPNEAGVPTKRCGGCHLDRYCSVECQAATYPGHMTRCQKIMAKRAKAKKSETE